MTPAIAFDETRPAAAQGFRMPAEWAPQRAVWLVPLHNEETWPGCFAEARAQFDVFLNAVNQVTPVHTPESIGADTNDSWIRDFGAIFVTRSAQAGGGVAAHDFRFNGWGGKYEVRNLDDAVAVAMANDQNVPYWTHDLVLEGGSIEVNGLGTLITTEQCLLGENRNPDLTRADIEQRLRDTLGITHIVWLPGGIVGDDTDGHIDDIVRFVDETTVVAVSAPEGHPDHAMTQANLAVLRQSTDQDGRPLRVVELPMPEPILYDFPPDRFGPGGVGPVPASYANFLISNDHLFLPVFGQPTDETAIRILADLAPQYRIVPLRADRLVVGLGSFHCLSMQQPTGH